jgi:very-short-patch-repair endonuclease
VPLPLVNQWIALADGHGLEVDFCWPDGRLVVETDGGGFHRTARAIENDSARDRLLAVDGWRVIRFTYRDVSERPAEVATQLRRLLLD